MSKQKALTKLSKLNKVRTLRKNLKKIESNNDVIITHDLLIPTLQTTF